MAKNLQKSAIPAHKKVGLLQPATFAQHVDLQYFDPSPALRPLVAHYFVGRAHLPADLSFTASDVLAQPETHLVLTSETSYIIGPASKRRSLTLRDQDIYAGIRFKVGGFSPFWHTKMTDLADNTTPAVKTFPHLNQEFVAHMLASQNNAEIAAQLETILLRQTPSADNTLRKIQAICTFIKTHKEVHSVHAVAQAFGISERTLQNMFAARVGVGVKWIIARARLIEAIEYAHTLEKPNWTTIAAQLGYSTQSHFINDFKKTIGMSPSQYTKMLRSD